MLTLVYGGSACGKSRWAENLALTLPGPWFYLATMEAADPESAARVARHRAQRAGKGFTTLEQPVNLAALKLSHRGTALLECLGNLAANELFSPHGAASRGLDPARVILSGIDSVAARSAHLILVTNNVFADTGHYPPATMEYIRLLAALNRVLAARAGRVVEVVCGLPIPVKGGIP